MLYGPGISDNTRGLTVLCALAQIIKAFGIRTRKSVIFLATVREEGTGGFEGLKFFLRNHPEVGLAISVDGPDAEFIVHGGAGSRTQIFTFSGRGGHAYKDFAKTGNPVAAAARAAAKIAGLKLPEDPRTTCVISQIHGGNGAGIHAIPKIASMSVNFRSAEQEQLEELDMHIAEAVAEGVREENDFAGGGVTVEKKQAVDVKAAFAPVESPEIQSMTALIKGLGMEPVYDDCCLTNARFPANQYKRP